MVTFDPEHYPYLSRRNVVYARRAMACTSVPQGAQIGLDVMKAGGQRRGRGGGHGRRHAHPGAHRQTAWAATASPWCGSRKRRNSTASTPAEPPPAALSAAKVRAMGCREMPREGWLPTMVPGAPAGWGRAEPPLRDQAPGPALRPGRGLRPGGGPGGGERGPPVAAGRGTAPARPGEGPRPPRLLVGEVHPGWRPLWGGGAVPVAGVRRHPGGAGRHRL